MLVFFLDLSIDYAKTVLECQSRISHTGFTTHEEYMFCCKDSVVGRFSLKPF